MVSHVRYFQTSEPLRCTQSTYLTNFYRFLYICNCQVCTFKRKKLENPKKHLRDVDEKAGNF